MSDKKSWQDYTKGQKAGVIIGAILILCLIGAIINKGDDGKEATDGAKEATSSKANYDDVCQTEINNKHIIDTNKIALVYITNYNVKTNETGRKDGDAPIYQTTWNGKNRDTDATVFFTCDVSVQSDGNTKVHYVSAVQDNMQIAEYGEKGYTTLGGGDNNYGGLQAYQYSSALQKCVVMEASDLNATTGAPMTAETYQAAKKTCEVDFFQEVYKQNGQQFYDDVSEDWTAKQDEQVDGKALYEFIDTEELQSVVPTMHD